MCPTERSKQPAIHVWTHLRKLLDATTDNY